MEKNSHENQNEIILSRLLKLMGVDSIQMDDFNNRLKYQKLIYLAQNVGINIGYGYSWYVRGPYSPLLTRTLYNIKEDPTLFEKGNTIKFKKEDEIVERLNKLRKVLGPKFDDPIYLEVLASLQYLHSTLSPNENSCSQLKTRLLTIKPNLRTVPDIHNKIESACKDLKKLN
jgi:hypothetical protein